MTAQAWIERLDLQPHPEGGYFRETYRSDEEIAAAALPPRYAGPRAFSTAIYFLLESEDYSAFHRVDSDELWHYHAGSPATLHLLSGDGELRQWSLGIYSEGDQEPQRLIPAGHWFAVTVDEPDQYVLVSCTVAPGFDFADFQLADADELTAAFPQHRSMFAELCHKGAS